ARPLRPIDLRSRGRDLLLRLRRPFGPGRGARRAACRPRSDSRRRGGLGRKRGEMKRRTVRMRSLLLVVGVVAVAATASLSAARANKDKGDTVPPDAVLTWNT